VRVGLVKLSLVLRRVVAAAARARSRISLSFRMMRTGDNYQTTLH
jgi:hypothetical protein